jgi:small subunit ribosomal protein S9
MAKYTYAIWRRKTSSAQIRLFEWAWENKINDKSASEYITRTDLFDTLFTPVKLCGLKDKVYFEVKVTWSGVSGQTQAIRHGLARALSEIDAKYRPILKEAGLLTRDARKVERKKPGKHKARKSSQWSKR